MGTGFRRQIPLVCTPYKRARTKARVKAQYTEGSDKCGAANAAEKVLKTSEVETNNGGNNVSMKALGGYFYNLASAAINKKVVLEQLVANNSKLAATNKDLVEIVKMQQLSDHKLTVDLQILGNEASADYKRFIKKTWNINYQLVPPNIH